MRQQGILLGSVPTVDLVDEQNGTPAIHPAPIFGLLDNPPQVGHARQHSADGLEMAGRCIGDDHRQRRLASAWRSPEDQ